MATHIVSWGANERTTSRVVPSTKPSIVSINSMLPYRRETSSIVQEAPRAAGSYAKHMSPLQMESSGSKTSISSSTYSRADAYDGSFIRHHKYFFKDGNVTFLADSTLYCVHQYFFSRDSVYFSTRFNQLGIRDHEALPITISLGNIDCKDFDAFLSILYPDNFEQHDLSYEEWKSVLHLSTRWDFISIRRLALNNIQPPTPHDRLLLARTYSVDHWLNPALSALCERKAPLNLDEARQMNIEDVVLVATVREDIRHHALQVDAAEISRRVKAAQTRDPVPPVVPTSGAVGHTSSLTGKKRASNGYGSDSESMEKQAATGAIGEDRPSQVQTASATVATPSAGQVAAKDQPADLIANKQPTHDAVEATQATGKTAPDASGDKSTSVPNGVDTTLTQETTPVNAVPEPERGEDPSPPPRDSSTPPPVPDKEPAVTNKFTPTSEETAASPPQTTELAPTIVDDTKETKESSAQPTEPEAPAKENADSSKLEAVEEGPKPQFGVDSDNRVVDEGSATQDGDVKGDGPTKLTLQMDRVRELSTASMMSSSSTPGTPAEEVASSAIEEEEGGETGEVGASNKKKKNKNKKKNKKKGEKNGSRPPSWETVSNADNSVVQDRNPPVVATTAPVEIFNGEGEGELVENMASNEEDAPIMVDKADGGREDPAAMVERPVGKLVDDDSGSDEWLDWQ